MTDTSTPLDLVRKVQADLAPVRPLPAPLGRTMRVAPLALALILAPPLVWGWRENLASLSLGTSWGLSLLQSLAGLALLWLAFGAAVPGRAVSRSQLALGLLGGASVFLTITLATANAAPTYSSPGAWLRLAWECVYMTLLFALPALVVAAVLVARALPTHAAWTGACYGMAVGLMTDAGTRLFCWIDEPTHVLASHGGSILIGCVGGALVAAGIERAKFRRLHRTRRSIAV